LADKFSFSHKKDFTINLSEVIPYTIEFSKDAKEITLTKGVITGEISLDSLALELAQRLNIAYEDVFFKKNEKNDFLIIFASEDFIDISIAESIILEMIAIELPYSLKNADTHKVFTYITENLFDIPLIGSMYFGVIDRGTNLLQVRSLTGCPLNCPFCSVDEGPVTKTKHRDFIVDSDYLVSTYDHVVKEKELEKAEAHLDGQGEPMAYPYIVDLVQGLANNPNTAIISVQTNGWYLTEKLVDDLEDAGLSRINLSINSMELSNAKRLSGRGDFPLQKILDVAEYIANSKISLLLAPLWIPGINDSDIEEIVKFSKKINSKEKRFPTLGIQNYLIHHQGRNMKGVKSKTFKTFNEQLREFERKYDVSNLVLKQSMFESYKSNMLSNPLKIGETISSRVILPGRLNDEVFTVAKNRIIHVTGAEGLSVGTKIKARIIRNRHNIFFAKKV